MSTQDPAGKSPAIAKFLEDAFGRTTHQKNKTCTMCGGPAIKFASEIAEKEYTLSGMCQRCQDDFFDSGADDDEDELFIP